MEHNIFCQNMTVYLFYFCMNMKYDNYALQKKRAIAAFFLAAFLTNAAKA